MTGRKLRAALAVGAAIVAGLLGCRGEPTTSGCPNVAAEGTPVDAPLMAFLSAARALHHEADLHERSGNTAGAIQVLQRLTALPAPSATEADEVLADTRARLAELLLGRGDLDGALREVQAGLLRVAGPTYFRGHLLEVEGLVEEARASSLADAGKADEAAAARRRAMDLLEDTVRIQQQVIEHALPSDGG